MSGKRNIGSPEPTVTSPHRFREAEAASGVGAFEYDFASNTWTWAPALPRLFGFDPEQAPADFQEWQRAIFIDDVPKLQSALEEARGGGGFYVELRVKRSDGVLHWLAGKGQTDASLLRGSFHDIDDRKQLEARLLSVNETLEARVRELRDEAHALEVLNRTGMAVGAELDLEKVVQIVTDAGVELSGAEFGAFFYNVMREYGESYML